MATAKQRRSSLTHYLEFSHLKPVEVERTGAKYWRAPDSECVGRGPPLRGVVRGGQCDNDDKGDCQLK